jgi:hypothetical protein
MSDRSFARAGRLALMACLAALAGSAAAGERSQRIDGSSPAMFEQSVGSLQERLSPRRRAKFETSLAIIWLRTTTEGGGDLNADGSVDMSEIRALQQLGDDVLAEIRRGVFVYAVGEREANAADYVGQLDGLGYHGVLDLADATSGAVFLQAVRRPPQNLRCRGLRQRADSRYTLVSEPPTLKSAIGSRLCQARR